MGDEFYSLESLFLSMESWSGPQANSSNPASFPPQGMPILDGGRSDTLSLDIPDVDAEAYSAGLCPSLHSTILAIDTAAETPYPEIPIATSNIHDEDLRLTCPSETDTTCQTTISSCTSLNSTLRGSQGSSPASVNSNEDPRDNTFAEADTNRSRRLGGMSMNAPLDHSPPSCTEIHTTSDFSILSTLPDDYSLPTVVPYQERASTEILQQSQNLGNGPMAASSRSPLKPNEDRYPCSICGSDCAQKRGVTRHHRDVHEVSLCLHCSGFEWHRRHQLEEHLEEQHPDVHVPAALAEATRYRRWATMIETRLQRQQAFPPAIEYYRWSRGEHLPQPLTPPLPPVLDVTHISSPAVSCVAYDPQPPTITNVTRGREYDHELALFDATYTHVAFSYTEARAPPPNAVDVSFWG